MWKKVLVVFLVVALLATAGMAKTKLNFWSFMLTEDAANNIIADFEAANPDIEVEYVQLSWANGFDKIVTAIAANAAPDVVELGNTWVANFASEGAIMNMNYLKEKAGETIVGWPSTEYMGDYYAYPWLLGTRAMFYNIDLMEQVGLDPENPPTTWAELMDAVQKIDALGNGIYGIGLCSGEPYSPWQQWFLPAAWGNYGKTLSADMKTATFNSPQMKDTGKFYQELSNHALMTKEADMAAVFGEGKLGFFIGGVYQVATFSANYPDLNYFSAFVPKPSEFTGTHASFAGGEVLAIPTQCKNVEAAEKLINYLVMPDVAMSITKQVPSIFPSNTLASQDPWFEDHIIHQIFFEQNAFAVPTPPHPKWTDIQVEISKAVEKIILEKADVDTVFDSANEAIQKIID